MQALNYSFSILFFYAMQCCYIERVLQTFRVSISSFLPPANEAAGRYMFLHLSAILFTWGCTPPGYTPPRQTPLQMATEGGGTHPTGMHSCFLMLTQSLIHYVSRPLLESVAIPVAKALCDCTFTVSIYFYDYDDYFGPSPKDHRVGVLSNFL